MALKSWVLREPVEVPAAVLEAAGGSQLVSQVLARRGILTGGEARAFLDPRASTRPALEELPGLARGVELVEAAVRGGRQICVWGDFDVDGQTSTTILVSCLREAGGRVSYHIPVRSQENHGIGLAALEKELDGGAQLLLTCDTGSGAFDAVEYAHSRSVPVVITDHHELPDRLPEAEAIVTPRGLPPHHPFASLPGAGVAYLFAEALLGRFGREGEASSYQDLAAMGIIADLAELRGEARRLAQLGLWTLRESLRPGLAQVMELAGVESSRITEEHVAYLLAPRLNALGRLSDANPAVELLTTLDPVRARILAQQVEALNARRKLMTDQVYAAALAMIDRDPSLLDHPALVLAHPAWPGGIVGIVASRLVERFERPVVLLVSPPGELARGSARSVAGCDITRAIASQAGLLAGYGGHPMAAGLSLDPGKISEFQRGLDRSVAGQLAAAGPPPGIKIEADLPLETLTLESVADLERLAPFGPGNPPLIFRCRNLAVRAQSPLGRGGEHRLVTVENERGAAQRVIWWQGGGEPVPEGRFDLAYTPRTSNFRGKPEIQIEWVDGRQGEAIEVRDFSKGRKIRQVDLRRDPRAEEEIRSWAARGRAQVWREGAAAAGMPGETREELVPATALVIWTAPPSQLLLEEAIRKVRPLEIAWVCREPGPSSPAEFTALLTGMVKYALRASTGKLSIPRLAAATAQREEAVLIGLEAIASQGRVTILSASGPEWQVAAGGSPDPAMGKLARERLGELLAETRAYRKFLLLAGLDRLEIEELPAAR